MRKGFLFMIAMLFVPTCIVLFLYVFGENKYSAQNPRYKNVTIAGAGTLATRTAGSVGVITLWPGAPTEQDCQFLDRLLYRLKVVQEKAPVAFVPVGRKGFVLGDLCHGLPLSEYGFVKSLPPGDSLAYSAVLSRIRMTDGPEAARTAILTDRKGQIVNVYDLKREVMLDTLVMESLIVIGGE